MRLAKLKLAGFKTFVDPTTVIVPGSLVGVVGPNGCGKSNIIDAVRWVLGESRASALRGESMQDVIFNGSTTRKAVSRASVELVFDNASGRAAGQWSRYAEVAVKRVLDRSGESSYFINGVQVRRKDVIDLFLGTGLGPRAYAIIEQGMISRIIEARPEEIRNFLEEAAGVTKYRERRRETEGRLSDARDNLTRLDDIRAELGERIDHLAAQAEVAARYRRLRATHDERQQLLWLLKRNEARAEATRLGDELNRESAQMEADSARAQELATTVEDERAAHFQASENTHAAQNALYAANAEVSRLESELHHLGEARRRVDQRLGELERETLHWQARAQALADDGVRWRELGDNAALRLEQAEARHAEIADRMPEADASRRSADTTVTAARRELAQTEQQLRVEETHRASAERALAGLEQRRARLDEEGASLVGPDALAIAQGEARLTALADEADTLAARSGQISTQRDEAQAALKQALADERDSQRRQTEVRARRDALVQLQAKVQAQGKLGDWLKRQGLEGVQAVWQRLRVEAGWERALEVVLRERLAALIDLDGRAAAALRDTAPPETLAVLLDDVREAADSLLASLPPPEPGWRALTDHVSTDDPALARHLHGWLHGVHAVDDLTPWLERHHALAGRVLVTPRGDMLQAGMLMHVTPDDRTHGVIEREREIDTLTAEQARLDEESRLRHDAVSAAEGRARALEDEAGEVRRRLQTLEQQRHSEEVQQLKLEQARSRVEERRGQLAADLADVARLADTERQHLARADAEQARCEELAERQRARLESAEALLLEHDAALRELRSLESSLAREVQEAGFSARECTSKLDEIARNAALADEQQARIASESEQNEAERENLAATDHGVALQRALELRQTHEVTLAAARDAQEEIAQRLRGTEELRLAIEQQARPRRDRVGELRLAVQAAQLNEQQFDERLGEAGADEAALAPLLTADLREAGLQREVGRLAREIAELGQVNLAALDELTEAETRKRYLDDQNDDLMQAILTLEDAIRRIDRETRTQLQETYDTVTHHFGQLFPQLFGGGQARLVLTGDEILDAGIQIVAQPPGKKNTSIHLLSGGEKALTAIALVFAMFQLNPAPFCMLDEVDAPLDDANTERYCQMVKRMSSQTQFVFISHSKITMEIAQQLIGVTMQEQGVSRIVEVDIEEAIRLAETAMA